MAAYIRDLQVAHTRRDGTWRGHRKRCKESGSESSDRVQYLLHVRRGSHLAVATGVCACIARPSRTAPHSSACCCEGTPIVNLAGISGAPLMASDTHPVA